MVCKRERKQDDHSRKKDGQTFPCPSPLSSSMSDTIQYKATFLREKEKMVTLSRSTLGCVQQKNRLVKRTRTFYVGVLPLPPKMPGREEWAHRSEAK